MSKAIIDGRIYNTETATEIGAVSGGIPGTFSAWGGVLYKTQRGRFFVEGYGGPASMFSVSCGQSSWSGGSGIRAIDAEDALAIACDCLTSDVILAHWPNLPEA